MENADDRRAHVFLGRRVLSRVSTIRLRVGEDTALEIGAQCACVRTTPIYADDNGAHRRLHYHAAAFR